MPGERINVEREIVVPEEPAEVWESLTDPDRLEEWFASGGRARRASRWRGRLPLGRRGGAASGRARVGGGSERLVLDWDDGGSVAIELEPVVDGTRVHVVESAPDFAPAFELRAMAWTALAAA